MSHKGMNGTMGQAGFEHPTTQKLIDIWNDLGISCGYIHSYEEELPKHLTKLSEAIIEIRKHFEKKMVDGKKFPIITPKVNDFVHIDRLKPPIDSWIFCFVDIKGYSMPFPALYKWQKENNPDNIVSWANLEAITTTGHCIEWVEWVQYPYYRDEKVILLCQKKDINIVIERTI